MIPLWRSMGIEYQASFLELVDDGVIAELARCIAGLPGVLPVEEPAAHRVRLRFSSHEVREEWPDDLVVELTPAECNVVFYGGGGDERHRLLAAIADVLRQHGVAAAFEEL